MGRSSGEITIRFGAKLEGRKYLQSRKSNLDLELLIDPLVSNRVVLQLLIETVALGCFDGRTKIPHRGDSRSYPRPKGVIALA